MLTKIKAEKADLDNKVKSLGLVLEAAKVELEENQKKIFDTSVRELYISEIYRLAKVHLPRLRREKIHELRPEDILELDKWINRARSSDGLKSIVDALLELDKYQPIDIRGNLYALIQRIIIGGPFHGKKK
jgi:hypothetical protein